MWYMGNEVVYSPVDMLDKC